MLDQSFSPANFRKIFDLDNRAGNYLEGRFFPGLEKLSRQLKTCVGAFKILRARRDAGVISPVQYEEAKLKLNRAKDRLREQKDEVLDQELGEIAKIVSTKNFRFVISGAVLGRKRGYVPKRGDAPTYFCMKQLQNNLRSMFKVRQGNRNWIVSQLKHLLDDKVPKIVVRTDLKEFYESVNRTNVWKEVAAHTILSQTTKRLLRKLFDACPASGLPRGIGISASLSEVAIREVDRRIQNLPGLVYYGRYVDDIVAIFLANSRRTSSQCLADVVNSIVSGGFRVNGDKTVAYDFPSPNDVSFDYLGYRFKISQGRLSISLSEKRCKKYRIRIARSFAHYSDDAKFNEKRAAKLLLRRIEFLTTNTRLHNNKKGVHVGAYFSNSHLTDLKDLRDLDDRLQATASKRGSSKLRTKIAGMSFEKGFVERRFVEFTPKELSQIGKPWSYE